MMLEDRLCFGELRPPHVQFLLLLSSFRGFGRFAVFGCFGEKGVEEVVDDVDGDMVDEPVGDHNCDRACGLGCGGSPVGTESLG
jgi:hypothetical protein